jgi:hypothetical protein
MFRSPDPAPPGSLLRWCEDRDWLVTGQVLPSNPAHAAAGAGMRCRKAQHPSFSSAEARELRDSMNTESLVAE